MDSSKTDDEWVAIYKSGDTDYLANYNQITEWLYLGGY